MTPSKEKEVRERFDDFIYSKRHTLLISDNGAEIIIQFLLSELSRVEKETENRVWRDAWEMVENQKRIAKDPTSATDEIYRMACTHISSTLLSQAKQDE